MARMSREFTLVVLGAGVLTAGYFAFREDNDLFAKEEEQSKQQVAGQHRTYHGPLVFLYGGGYSGGRSSSPATAGGVARGGFGSMGAHAGS